MQVTMRVGEKKDLNPHDTKTERAEEERGRRGGGEGDEE